MGEAFSWAWNKFSKNAVPLIVATLVFGAIAAILYGIIYGIAFALAPASTSTYDSYGNGFEYSTSASLGAGSIIVLILGGIVFLVAAAAMSSAYIGGVLDIANGQPVTIGSFFKPRYIGNVIVATLIVAIVSAILSICFIGGLVVSLFAMFTTIALIDQNLSAIDAIKASINIVKDNFGQALLAWLVALLITFVGAILCGVGLLVAIPVVLLFEVYTYRKLTGGQVAPLTP